MMAGEAAQPRPMLHIEAVQTVTPGKPVEPRPSRRIEVVPSLRGAVLRAHSWVVLYYYRKKKKKKNPAGAGEASKMNSGSGGDNDTHWAWEMATRMKDSLNEAVPGEPLLAGRLWFVRTEDSTAAEIDVNGERKEVWEIKYNDAGIRLVQATAEMSLEEFLGSETCDEAKLAYWKDVDPNTPYFSALFYVQLTEFKGGDGYSVGISSSLLLADPVIVSGFLKNWSSIHARMIAGGHHNPYETAVFHLSTYITPSRPHVSSSPLLLSDPRPDRFPAEDVLVNVNTTLPPPPPEFYSVAHDRLNDALKVVELLECGEDNISMSLASWSDLVAMDVVLEDSSKPVKVSFGLDSGDKRLQAVRVEDDGYKAAATTASSSGE